MSLLSVAVLAAGFVAVQSTSTDDPAEALSNPVEIMFVGDSITSGQTLANAMGGSVVDRSGQWPTYRGPLFDKLTGQAGTIHAQYGQRYGLSVKFVGSEDGVGNANGSDYTNRHCPSTAPTKVLSAGGVTLACDYNNRIKLGANAKNHEGHDGWTLDEMINGVPSMPTEGRLQIWMQQQTPDILVLLAGANDLGSQTQNPAGVVDEFEVAIAAARAVKPDVRIVIPTLFPHQNNQSRTDKIIELNALLPQLTALTTAQSPIIVPDLFSGYCSITNPENPASCGGAQFANDGSHPGTGGREHIAKALGDSMVAAGYFSNSLPAPQLNNITGDRNVVRGSTGEKITIGGNNFFANSSFSLGDGIDIVSATYVSPKEYVLTFNVSRFAAPGPRTLTMTSVTGAKSTRGNAISVSTAPALEPRLKVMLVGDEIVVADPANTATHPSFRQRLYARIDGTVYNFTTENATPTGPKHNLALNFVGDNSGIGTGASAVASASPLTDPDHQGRSGSGLEFLALAGPGGQAVGPLADAMRTHDPDVVVISTGHIDARDLNMAGNLDQQMDNLMERWRPVLRAVLQANPYAKILITDLTPHRTSAAVNDQIAAYNARWLPRITAIAQNLLTVFPNAQFARHQVGHPTTGWNITPANDLSGSLYLDNSHGAFQRAGDGIYNVGNDKADACPGSDTCLKSKGRRDFWTIEATQPPAPPAAAPALTAGNGQAVVRWQDPPSNFDAAQIDKFIIQATPTTGGAPIEKVVDVPNFTPGAATPRSSTITGLANGKTYIIKVAAISARGQGVFSAGSQVTPSAGGGGGGGGGGGAGGGYVVLEQDGDLWAFGTARALIKSIDPGAVDHTAQQATETGIVKARLNQSAGGSAVAIELTADKKGLWVLRSDGVVMSFGNAPQLPGVPAGVMTKTVAGQPERVAALARLGNGRLWVFTTAGRVVPQGGALPAAVQTQMNSILGLNLLAPIVDAKPTMDGTGVVAMATDGGIFTYNAPFLGSVYDAIAEALKVPVGSIGPDRPVVGITMDPDGDGYWVVAEDGGVFTPKSRAPFRGSLPAIVPFDQLFAPVNGMVPFGNGYLLVAGDGGVFNFSNLGFSGSASGLIDTTAVGIAPI